MKIKEHPIIFSGEMIRRILSGEKMKIKNIKIKISSGVNTWTYSGLDGEYALMFLILHREFNQCCVEINRDEVDHTKLSGTPTECKEEIERMQLK
jgi:hypothetical protein